MHPVREPANKVHVQRNAELDLGSEVQRLSWPLSPLQFQRDYVSRNKPCLLTGMMGWITQSALLSCISLKQCNNLACLHAGAISHWPALSAWNQQYLSNKLHDKLVHYALAGATDECTPAIAYAKLQTDCLLVSCLL